MRKYTTFAELESLLLTAINLPGFSIKTIAAATGIKANTLYKWKTTPQPSFAGEGRQVASLLYGTGAAAVGVGREGFIIKNGSPRFAPAAQNGGFHQIQNFGVFL